MFYTVPDRLDLSAESWDTGLFAAKQSIIEWETSAPQSSHLGRAKAHARTLRGLRGIPVRYRYPFLKTRLIIENS